MLKIGNLWIEVQICLMFSVKFVIVRVDASFSLFCGCDCFAWDEILSV